MSENNYGALMMKSALSASVDIDSILLPGIYPVSSGNPSAPDVSGGGFDYSFRSDKTKDFFI